MTFFPITTQSQGAGGGLIAPAKSLYISLYKRETFEKNCTLLLRKGDIKSAYFPAPELTTIGLLGISPNISGA